MIFPIIGKKNNQSSVSDADREIPTLRLMDSAGNSVNLVSSFICLALGCDFSVCIGDRCWIPFLLPKDANPDH